jgi:hypothetical protein
MATELRTWLIQRLTKPYATGNAPAPSVVYRDAFRKPGKVPDEIMAMRGGLFGFDYMGAAEFEFGAIPEALRRIAAFDDLRSTSITISKADIAVGWRGETAKRDATIYLLARPAHEEHAERVIRDCAAERREMRLKESTYLPRVLTESYDHEKIGGWLELDNGFWFFTDKAMRDGVCALFGVRP